MRLIWNLINRYVQIDKNEIQVEGYLRETHAAIGIGRYLRNIYGKSDKNTNVLRTKQIILRNKQTGGKCQVINKQVRLE